MGQAGPLNLAAGPARTGPPAHQADPHGAAATRSADNNPLVTHYSKAPIIQAIIDIQVVAASRRTVEQLAELQSQAGGMYPEKLPVLLSSLTVTMPMVGPSPALGAATTNEQNGWGFVHENKLQMWQARADGFSFIRRAPYETWEAFRSEARRLWDLTRELLNPSAVSRVGLRYVNRIELPIKENLRFDEFLRTAPDVSVDLPQRGVSTYFMQLQIPQDDLRSTLLLSQQLLPPVPSVPQTTVAVLLDIDLSRTFDLPTACEGIWDVLDQFRHRKNKVFEACITEPLRELIR